jgi:hypothetical protein
MSIDVELGILDREAEIAKLRADNERLRAALEIILTNTSDSGAANHARRTLAQQSE